MIIQLIRGFFMQILQIGLLLILLICALTSIIVGVILSDFIFGIIGLLSIVAASLVLQACKNSLKDPFRTKER